MIKVNADELSRLRKFERDVRARNPEGSAAVMTWTDEQVKVFIGIEKRLCAALGKPWQSTGMSTDTLLTDVERELTKLRKQQGVCLTCGRIHECPRFSNEK